MKAIIIFLLICGGNSAIGQFSLQPRIGLNENTHVVFAMDIAYAMKGIELAAVIDDVQSTHEAAYFGGRIGYRLYGFMPFIGKSYHYFSNDKTEFTNGTNYWVTNIGIRYEHKSHVFIQAEYMKQYQITIGLRLLPTRTIYE